jgi:predicted alpha-1,2-mannosidase
MGWANHQQLFFALEFSKPFQKFALVKDEVEVEGKVAGGKGLKAWFRFDARQESQVLVKVGISAVSIEGARKNMKAELPGWDFESTRKKAMEQWNQELNRIQVKGALPEQAAIFYTALYHSFLAPNLFSDVDGSYRGMDGEVHRNSRNDQYTIFSLWDTFRATHPLFTLVQEERTVDLINSLLSKYAESGQLPIWELAANETGTMIGYHSVPVIVDAYLKGIRGFDVEKAYEAIKASAMREDRGLNWYKKYEFIPMEREGNSVSKVLEYAYDDWCIAQMARELGEEEDYLLFIQRAQYYKNLYNKESGFMRGRSANGNWREEFDPASTSVLGGGDFTEGNSWQYSFFVPQDIEGFTALLGGSQQLIDKLDQLFAQSSVIDNAHTPDVSGLIGMYAHGNEPSHHVAYLYNYAGAPWKTQERVHQIMDSLYTDRPDGLCGNEDCGQMSAWYVMSAMGFYPVCPGSNEYAIGTPLFPETTINLENGNQFVIKAKQVSRENKYIQKVQLNGEVYPNSFLLHEDILAGGILEFEMGAQPNKKWGRRLENRPQSFIEEENRMEAIDARRVMLPYVVNKGRIFGSRMLTELACNTPGAEIFYTLDGSEPSRKSFRYLKPIVLNHSLELKAKAFKKGMQPSLELKEEFIRAITHEPGRKYPRIIERTEASAPYNQTGYFALLDGVRGSDNFGDGNWTGFNGNNLEMVIDLGRRVPLNRITLSYLQNTGSWIFPPRSIQFALSDDGKTFRTVNESGNNEPQDHLDIAVRRVSHEFSKQRSRFVKIVAENFGKLPEWHSGAGNDAWLFVDEVVIE